MKMLRFFIAGIGVLVVANQARATECHLQDFGTLPVEMIDSQPTTVVKVNGTDKRFILDTGAFYNMMSHADAGSLALTTKELPVDLRISGIGGATGARYTQIKEFGILDTTLKNVNVIVGGADTGYPLIGANLLDFADLEIDLAHGKVTLFKSKGCDQAPLAYWSKDGNYHVADIAPSDDESPAPQTVLDVMVNGKKLHALVDSGADMTVLSRHAADKIGIDLNGPHAKPSGGSRGIGAKTVKSWTVDIDSFSIAGETTQHTKMVVLDGALSDMDTDMLLGADFLLAHRMFIANSQHKVYFTYNGGRVFALANPSNNENSTGGNEAPLKSADDYALRGEASLSRGASSAAIVDLDEAIRLAPDQPTFYLARARAHFDENQVEAALADLDKSISLEPKNVDALLLRAGIRLSLKNSAGAIADVNAARTLAPADSANSRSIASLYIALDQPVQALPLLDAWISVHNNDVLLGDALYERCLARSLNNQLLEDALSDCRNAIKRDGENPAYLEGLGMTQLRLGHYAQSIDAYQRALAQENHSAWSHYGLGLAKIRSGQKDAGNADLVAARAIEADIDTHAAKFGLTVATP